jgi:hypothetical protein
LSADARPPRIARPCSPPFDYGFSNFAGYPDTHDAGLIILDAPAQLAEYGALPEPGFLDPFAKTTRRQDVTFEAAGEPEALLIFPGGRPQ